MAPTKLPVSLDDVLAARETLTGVVRRTPLESSRPLSELIEDKNFYGRDLVGLNYAQARYLMFYLQEKKLLQKYYQAFRDGVKDDATGLATLKTVIGEQSLDNFEKQWRKWVLTLEFPR